MAADSPARAGDAAAAWPRTARGIAALQITMNYRALGTKTRAPPCVYVGQYGSAPDTGDNPDVPPMRRREHVNPYGRFD
jgi:hypothetical protein